VSAEETPKKRQSKTEKRQSLLWLTEAQAALSWGVILVLAALVGAIYLFQASRIARVGRQVQELQWELDEVNRLNGDLERDIAEAQSLDRLQQEVLRLGFVRADPDDVDYLVIPNYPAEIEATHEAELLLTPDPINNASEALWLTIESSISDLFRGESP
jgi:cell division protein FtsL